MLFIFGDTSTQLYSVFASAVQGLKGVELGGLEAVAGFLERTRNDQRLLDEASLVLMGCQAEPFGEFWVELVQHPEAMRSFMAFRNRSILCCDSVKWVWAEFLSREQSRFEEVHVLDTPVPPAYLEPGKYNQCMGAPIGHLIRADEIDPQRVSLFTFAGSLDTYPERVEAIRVMQGLGLPLELQSALDARRYWDHNPYRNYVNFLLHSLFTLNFPATPIGTGGELQIKARFWEALATGAILVETRNPLEPGIANPPPVVNYTQPEELVAFFCNLPDRQTLLARKRQLIEKHLPLFDPLTFFRQLDPML